MTADPDQRSPTKADEARRELDEWIDSWVNDPDLEAKLADLRQRAAKAPSLSNADLAEALGLPAQFGDT